MFIAYWLLTYDSQSPSRKGHTTNHKCANMSLYYDILSPKIHHILQKKNILLFSFGYLLTKL